MSDFNLAIPSVLRHEGGLVDDSSDPGGITNFGISKRCLSPETRILTADLQWIQAREITPGQEILAFDEIPEKHGKLNLRRFRRATVTAVKTVALPSSRITTTQTELIAGDDHLWLQRWGQHRVFNWCRTSDLLKLGKRRWTNGTTVRIGRALFPWDELNTRDAGYLAAVLDGEGHIGSTLAFSQKTGNALVQQAQECCSRLGLRLEKGKNERCGVRTYKIVNQNHEPYFAIRLAGMLGATRLLALLADDVIGKNVASTYAQHDTVINVESVGVRELIALSTSSATVIAEGLLTHNSYPDVDIKNLTVEDAKTIYKRDWWDAHHYGDIIPQAVANKVFDTAVNLGASRAHRILQEAAGVAVDGILGPATLSAVNTMNSITLLFAFQNLQAQHYRNLVLANPSLQKFLNGWIARAFDRS